ncbi:MAG: palindromic element RPE1 domain-containing protein [Rickettsia endosymbiont of Labidopullus appendiculatus]|nr:palindromic element RPE1 domain-containing protein [Rickettsia endosymbiont of Labidopullus appendiculatus]
MPYPTRIPEHFHIEVLKYITLTIKHPIDIKVALQPKGTVELPLGNNSYSFQNQSTIDSSCDSHDRSTHCNSCNQSKQILILNKDSITSILLPIGTKVSLTQKNIRPLAKLAYAEEFEGNASPRTAAYSSVREDSSTASLSKLPPEVEFCKRSISYHFENTTAKQLSITDLNLFINTYEYLTGELSATLLLIARNELILLEIEDHDKTYLKYYKKDKYLIDLFDEQNKKIINHEEIDLFIKYYLESWHYDVNHNEYIDDHTSTSLLGTLEEPTG